jgi:phosphate transport system substrate-binding protein
MKITPMFSLRISASKPFSVRILAALAAFASLGGVGRADDPSPAPTNAMTVTISASSALVPLAKAAATKYGLQYTGMTVSVASAGSTGALRALAAGSIDVALTDTASTDPNTIDHKIAVLAFAFVANHANGVSSLTADQIRSLLSGKIANWSEVGGANVPVHFISRGPHSGVTQLLERKYLGGKPQTAGDAVVEASATAVDEVKRTPGGISVVTAAAARAANANVTTLAIDGAPPDESHVCDGSYPLWAYEHAVTQGAPSTATSRFLSLIESDRTMLHSLGFIAVADLGPGALTP